MYYVQQRNCKKGISTFVTKYLLTPWCRVLLEKLTGLQVVKKFPAFHGTRRFITAIPSVRHLSVSWDSPIQSINLHPTSWRSILFPCVSWFPCFYKQMLTKFITFQVTTTCFSCGPPDLNLLLINFKFCLHVK